eukprot:TRINITY_DN7994_c1_g1_i1.p1 TRINITY_DN7994_c1_g1~~TRINITY_DN7994_c1_g1_i1.p1  ORF type:complete len:1311 (-),score=229.47 TRINITY_DN7994_c1_g1_i1:880-4740(-)
MQQQQQQQQTQRAKRSLVEMRGEVNQVETPNSAQPPGPANRVPSSISVRDSHEVPMPVLATESAEEAQAKTALDFRCAQLQALLLQEIEATILLDLQPSVFAKIRDFFAEAYSQPWTKQTNAEVVYILIEAAVSSSGAHVSDIVSPYLNQWLDTKKLVMEYGNATDKLVAEVLVSRFPLASIDTDKSVAAWEFFAKLFKLRSSKISSESFDVLWDHMLSFSFNSKGINRFSMVRLNAVCSQVLDVYMESPRPIINYSQVAKVKDPAIAAARKKWLMFQKIDTMAQTHCLRLSHMMTAEAKWILTSRSSELISLPPVIPSFENILPTSTELHQTNLNYYIKTLSRVLTQFPAFDLFERLLYRQGERLLLTSQNDKSILCDVVVDRIVALYDKTLVYFQQTENPPTVDQMFDLCWGEWHRTTDFLYSLINRQFISFRDLILKLSKRLEQDEKYPLKNSSILWMIVQCFPSEPVKTAMTHDIQIEPQPYHMRQGLLKRIISFDGNMTQGNPLEMIWAPSIRAISSRLQTTSAVVASIEEIFTIPPQNNRLWEKLMAPSQGLNSATVANSSLDFYQQESLRSLSASVQSCEEVMKYLLGDVTRKQAIPSPSTSLPNYFCGPDTGLPTMYLSILSLQASHRALTAIERKLLETERSEGQMTDETLPSPGCLQTYYCMMYLAPSTLYKLNLHTYFLDAKKHSPSKLSLTLDLIIYRLIRYYRKLGIFDRLVVDCIKFSHNLHMYGQDDCMQLYGLVQTFVLKLSAATPELLFLIKADDLSKFGSTAIRALINSMILSSRINQVPCEPGVLKNISNCMEALQCDWRCSLLTKAPAEIQSVLQRQLPYQGPRIEMERIKDTIGISEWNSNIGKGMKNLTEDFRRIENAVLFLPRVLLEGKDAFESPKYIAGVQTILKTFSPQILDDLSFAFVSFFVDRLASCIHGPETMLYDRFRLSAMIWNAHLLRLDSTVFALMDCAMEPSKTEVSLATIDFLLRQDGEFHIAVQAFLALNLDKKFWQESKSLLLNAEFNKNHSDNYLLCESLPEYFGNICLRMLPVLDMLIMRLFDLGQENRIIGIIIQYHGLYQYHDNAATFVRNVLLAIPRGSMSQNLVRIYLLQLIDGTILRRDFFDWAATSLQQSQEAPFQDLPGTIEGIIQQIKSLLPSGAFATGASLSFQFSESVSPFDYVATVIMIEVLLLPVDPATLIKAIVSGVTEVYDVQHTYEFYSYLGALISLLPQTFREGFCAYVANAALQDIPIEWGHYLGHPTFTFDNFQNPDLFNERALKFKMKY